jgi:hypothetical protein
MNRMILKTKLVTKSTLLEADSRASDSYALKKKYDKSVVNIISP